MKKHIPNILTYGRVVLCGVTFWALAMLARAVWQKEAPLPVGDLQLIAFWSFVVAGVTDFFDGWLARRWNVVSMTGAILDPIADKVLVCVAILGLLAIGLPGLLLWGGLILVREFSVSALREVLAPKGIKLPVTFLAKTKTTLQLVALSALMAVWFWGGRYLDPATAQLGYKAAEILFGFAAAVTLWTGIEYGLAARKALLKV